MRLINCFLTFSFVITLGANAQVSTTPSGIGIGVNNATIPLHINKPGEVVRLDGTAPYLSLSHNANWQGYLQATPTGNFEIGTKNGGFLNFFTNDIQRMVITSTGRVNFLNGININGSVLSGGAAGSVGQVFTSAGVGGSPYWETVNSNPKTAFSAIPSAFSSTIPASTEYFFNNLTELYDESLGGGSFNATTGIFTAEANGVYHFTINMNFGWTHSITSGVFYFDIYKNNTSIKQTPIKYKGDDILKFDGYNHSFDLVLNLNDQIKFSLSTSNQLSIFGNGNLSPFEISCFRVY